MKYLICHLLLLLIGTSLSAQSVRPEVVSTAGETFSNSTVILEWTLGEIMTETYPGSTVLTQGFHQPLDGNDKPLVARCIESFTVELDENGDADFNPIDLDAGSSGGNTPTDELLFSFDPAQAPFDCNDVGTEAVALIVTDSVGQTDTCFTLVTVEDNIPPTLTCQSVTLELDPVAGAIALSLVIDGALLAQDDNCALRGPEITGPLTYDCTHLGENNETITMVDVNGNTSTCDLVVTIIDPADVCSGDTPPLARCVQSITVQTDATGEVALEAEDLNDGSSDVETAAEDLMFDLGPGALTLDCDDVGQPARPVALIVTDNVGQTDTCFTQVTVEDNVPPEVSCQNVVIELEADQSATLSFDLITDVILTEFADNCVTFPAEVPSAQTHAFACDNLGVETRDFRYFDGNGNEESCTGVELQITDPLGVCGEDLVVNCVSITIDDQPGPTVIRPASTFNERSDGDIYAFVYSDETDRQENTNFECSTTGINQGQTFTAGQTGVIQSIKVRAGASTNTTLFVREGGVLADTAGQYAQNVELFFGQYRNQANLTVMTLDEPFPVVAGQEYTFQLAGETTLSRSCPGAAAYADGIPILGFSEFSSTGDEDLTFEVNIIGPTEMEFPTEGSTPVTIFAVDEQGNVSEGCETFLNPNQPLPVEWLSFGAAAGAKQVDLQWETTEEPDNAGFHVERSVSGGQWSVIGQVQARSGTGQRYEFVDQSPNKGRNYYRIRQTDFDGQVTYSQVASVLWLAEELVSIYPNPASSIVTIQVPEGAELLGLLDISGKPMNAIFSGREGQLTTDVSQLPDGLYVLRTRLADGRIVVNRLVVQ